MKRLLLLACSLFLVLPLFAAQSDVAPMIGAGEARHAIDLPPIDKTFAQALAEKKAVDQAGILRAEPKVVLEGSEAGFVIPVAGSGAGGGGTYFRTEAVVINRRSISQDVLFFFFPINGGAANCNRSSVRKRLDANAWYLYTDLVSDVFGVTAFGAVIMWPVDSAGNYDSNARIDGNARIWTPQPGTTNGTTGQNFPSMSLAMPVGTGTQSTWGLRLDEFYRSNWGIFNYDTAARTFDVVADGFRGTTSFSVTIDACSLVQQAIPGGPLGSFELMITPRDSRANYFTYGSSVDNVTGDAWSVTGRSF